MAGGAEAKGTNGCGARAAWRRAWEQPPVAAQPPPPTSHVAGGGHFPLESSGRPLSPGASGLLRSSRGRRVAGRGLGALGRRVWE